MELIYILDIIGVFVFAISGALTASDNKMDAFGSVVIAFITALGGGTIRDLLLGSQPVSWMHDTNYFYVVILAICFAYLFKNRIEKLRKTMFLFDTIGIGLFTVLGVQKTLVYELSPIICVMMGTVSAVFGGVTRDILTNRIPLIFRKEIYATACILGGSVYLMMTTISLPDYLSLWTSILLVMAVRFLAVKNKWSLPGIK